MESVGSSKLLLAMLTLPNVVKGRTSYGKRKLMLSDLKILRPYAWDVNENSKIVNSKKQDFLLIQRINSCMFSVFFASLLMSCNIKKCF